MEILLTGSTGFVGRNLLLRLIQEERWSRIILPVRDPQKLRAQLAGELGEGAGNAALSSRLHILGVSGDAWGLPSSVRPDLVIHAAGRLFGRERAGYFQTNVQGSLALAARLPASARVIVLSSLAAGGPTPDGALARTLDHPDAPVSFYGDSKLAMERELRAMLGERLLVLRPPMVLGPRDSATLPLFQMVKGPIRMKPGLRPKQYSWIAVDDLCDALLAASHARWPGGLNDGRGYYLAAKRTITDVQLLATAAEALGRRGVSLPVPQSLIRLASHVIDAVPAWRGAVPSLGRDRVREILPERWVCDGSSFPDLFDWQPRRGLSDTLRETAAWFQAQGNI